MKFIDELDAEGSIQITVYPINLRIHLVMAISSANRKLCEAPMGAGVSFRRRALILAGEENTFYNLARTAERLGNLRQNITSSLAK